MKRVLLGTVLLFVVAIGAALYYVLSSLDAIVAREIERYGSRTLGVAVQVGSVEISLREGRGTIRDLRVGNPAGFDAPHAFRLEEITLDLDPKSVTASPVVIEELIVRAPAGTYELDRAAHSNLEKLRANLEGDAKQGGAGGQAAGEKMRLVVERFVFERGELTAMLQAVGGKDTTLKLPALELRNLGGREGATGGEIGEQVLNAYLNRVLQVVASSQIQRLIEKELGGEVGEAVKGLLDRFSR